MNSGTRNGLSYSECGKLGYQKSKDKILSRFKSYQEKYHSQPKKCLLCDTNLTYEMRYNKFCSSSCSASFNNKGICRITKTYSIEGKKLPDIYKLKSKKFCVSCSKELTIKQKKFCSIKCQHVHEWNLKKSRIDRDQCININPIFNSKTARRYLKEVRGIKCEICNLEKWMGKEIPIVLDHIDGNSDNWELKNLRLICGNCDMQTSTYKNKNKGRGRFYRRSRYKNGLSY